MPSPSVTLPKAQLAKGLALDHAQPALPYCLKYDRLPGLSPGPHARSEMYPESTEPKGYCLISWEVGRASY